MAGAMIYVHEGHEVVGGRMAEFGEAVRAEGRAPVGGGGHPRPPLVLAPAPRSRARHPARSVPPGRGSATRGARMISVAACWTVAPGTGRHHEVVLLQKIEDWTQFSRLLTQVEPPARKGSWMEEGLRYRDRWESKLLRCASWSPRQ